MTGIFPPLSKESKKNLDGFHSLIDRIFPLPSRFRHLLPDDIAELSGLFTSNRGERGASYLGRPNLLSAYLRYFLPWNIYRLCRLLPGLPLELKNGDAINDIGCGPLTLVISLWICRPEFRKMPLEFRCIDRTPSVMDAGRKIFNALAGDSPWIIKTIRGEIRNKPNYNLNVEIRGKKAALCSALNLYNEIFWDFSPRDGEKLDFFAKSQAALLDALTEQNILVVEPGIPRSGEFISRLRSHLLEKGSISKGHVQSESMSKGQVPLSPCTHSSACPFPGSHREKWCHFAFDSADAPSSLHKLSNLAGLPKERAVISYIFTGKSSSGKKVNQNKNASFPVNTSVRILSDSFPLMGERGRYGCSEYGAVLVHGNYSDIEKINSGSLIMCNLSGKRDEKSGAFLAPL